MSSVQELNERIKDLKAKYRMSKNEATKLDIVKKLEDTKKELRAKSLYETKEAPKKEEKKEVKTPEVVKEKEESIDDMNRGKVAEPGSSIPESKHDDKKEEKKDYKNQKSNRN